MRGLGFSVTNDHLVVIITREEHELEGLNVFAVEMVDVSAERRLGAVNTMRCHHDHVPDVVSELVASWLSWVDESE